MTQASFDGFSVLLPEGWAQIDDDASYSDPSEGDRKMFGRAGEAGSLIISVLPIDPEDPPSATTEHVESLAVAWGRARGLSAPASISVSERPDGALARAEYKLAADYIAVWFLSNGELTLQVSYVCGWASREVDRRACEGIVASLSFA